MKRLFLLSAVAVCCLAPLACDLEKTANQISAETVMVGTLLSTPDVAISPEAVAGLDGGVQADGGQSSFTLPGQTAAVVFMGTRNGTNATPEGLTGATVTIQTNGTQKVSLTSDGFGSYSRSSNSDATLTYQNGATYEFIAERGGEKFVGQVKEAPARENIPALHPAAGVVRMAANTELAFDRAEPASGQERTLGFVTVIPVSDSGQQGEPTYTNVPKAPLDFIKLVAAPVDWKVKRVTIPGSAFPLPKQTYLVIFQSVRTGGPQSENLFLGSALLAGTADVGVVHTQ
ncbi:hypothetical protein [Hyalangium minutum]|uniref:Putative lipoprotein n=1 Tax=Hyalangium minutum TaxID=394096 RepID=A0A085WAN3_9BACT|nr:hypothetical protein [Hyalangium minutum]KFE64746.1 putative lipoprotein [Hyalangium minutum]